MWAGLYLAEATNWLMHNLDVSSTYANFSRLAEAETCETWNSDNQLHAFSRGRPVSWSFSSFPTASMSAGSFLLSSRVPLPKSFPPDFTWSPPNSLLLRSKPLSTASLRGSYVRAATAAGGGEGDFISKVLKENPTQVEPKFLVGERFLTLRDKHGPGKPPVLRISQLVKRLLGDSYGSKGKCGQEGTGECMNQSQNTVYLKDILREFKGQLYVPEEVFMENLSEEEVFDRDIHELPLLSFEDFQKHLTAGKIKQLTSKSMVGVPAGVGYRDFIVDLIETPGDKNLQKTRWAIRLSAAQTQAVYEEYKGARYEIEKQMRVRYFY